MTHDDDYGDDPWVSHNLRLTYRGRFVLGAVAGVAMTLLVSGLLYLMVHSDVGPTGKPLHINADCTNLKG